MEAVNTSQSNIYSNVRYVLSSKIMNEFLVQWTTSNQAQALIEGLIKEVKTQNNIVRQYV